MAPRSRESNIGNRRRSAQEGSGVVYTKRRGELVHAAATVFREKGYLGATLKDVAGELGMNPATIYYYYRSKQELFQAVVEQVVTENVARATEIRDRDLPPAEKLRAILKLLMRSYSENYPHMFVFLQEDPSRLTDMSPDWADRMRKWSRDYYRIIREIIGDGLDDGSLTSDLPPWFLAQSVVGMVNWTHRWYEPGGAVTAEMAGEGFADIVLQGLATSRRRR